jgi:hypothetical protein
MGGLIQSAAEDNKPNSDTHNEQERAYNKVGFYTFHCVVLSKTKGIDTNPLCLQCALY